VPCFGHPGTQLQTWARNAVEATQRSNGPLNSNPLHLFSQNNSGQFPVENEWVLGRFSPLPTLSVVVVAGTGRRRCKSWLLICTCWLQIIQTPDLFFFCKDNPGASDLCQHQSQGLAKLVGQPNPTGGRWQMGLNDFQKFALVLDVDGNSWSSRWGMRVFVLMAAATRVRSQH